MVKSSEIEDSEIEEIVTRFPGPVTLLPSRKKWWAFIIASSGMTAACIFLLVFIYHHPSRVVGDVREAVGLSIVCATFFGLCTGTFVIALCRGALRLDKDGFEVTGLYRKRYSWCEVSDFGVFSYKGTANVVFKTKKLRWTVLGKLNALLTGGRSEGLPDTYGLGAAELMQLMKTWQSSATNAISP
jgi:hypothetical protein